MLFFYLFFILLCLYHVILGIFFSLSWYNFIDHLFYIEKWPNFYILIQLSFFHRVGHCLLFHIILIFIYLIWHKELLVRSKCLIDVSFFCNCIDFVEYCAILSHLFFHHLVFWIFVCIINYIIYSFGIYHFYLFKFFFLVLPFLWFLIYV